MPASILFVHQGYELYGSDRTLIQSVQAAHERWPAAHITVLLPNAGPLRDKLLESVEDVRITDLAILRKSDLKKARLRDVPQLVRKVMRARRMMLEYDVTYINTVMVMDYILAAAFTRGEHIVHVHEIPTGVAAVFFSVLLAASRAALIFNSRATQKSFTLPFWQQRKIAWNGVAAPRSALRKDGQNALNLLLIGRFNAWKGQSVLIRAVAQLPHEFRSRVQVRLVGSVFARQMHFIEDLERLVEQLGLSQTVQLLPFADDPASHYEWADVVVVPSTRPEPFGLVAIEGMAAGCSVIASDHGGVAEIVIDGETGTLVEPGSVDSLATAILSYVKDASKARLEGEAGRMRFAAEFDEERYKRKITDIIADLGPRRSARQERQSGVGLG